jgi:hypothetical protein
MVMEMTVRLYTATATYKGISFEVQACTDGGELYKVSLLWEIDRFREPIARLIRFMGRFVRVAHISILNVE